MDDVGVYGWELFFELSGVKVEVCVWFFDERWVDGFLCC